MADFFDSIPFPHYKKYATPVRIFIAIVVGIQFFGFYDLPDELLYPVAVLGIIHLTSIGFEKSRLSTVEIAERKCPQCKMPMYSKVIKCEKCKFQVDTDEERDEKE